MNRLDLYSLEIFRQVALEGSISVAARRLNRVQSNISTRVKQIEELVGTPLFERGRKGMILTESGHTLLGYADRLLQLSEQAMQAVGNGEPKGVFRIGTMEATAASRLPKILSQYHEQCRNVEVHVRTDTSAALIGQLKANQLDVAFVAESAELNKLNSLPVFKEALTLMMPKSFPEFDPDYLNGKTMVAFEEGCAYRRYLDQWLLENGILPGKKISIGSYLGMFACISAGTGFGVIPQSVLDTLTVPKNFYCSKLSGEYSKIKTMMVWRPGFESLNFSYFSKIFLEAENLN